MYLFVRWFISLHLCVYVGLNQAAPASLVVRDINGANWAVAHGPPQKNSKKYYLGL